MCRSLEKDGVYRRCPNDSDGSRGCEYIDERIKKTSGAEDIPTQKFSQVHKETLEELKQEHPEEVLQQKVEPEDYEKFKKSVNKMISESEMSDHDKMIARKQWNRAEKEVQEGQVTVITLATWQKALLGTVMFMLNTTPHQKGSFQQRWNGIYKALNMSVDIRDYYKDAHGRVISDEELEEDRRQQRALDRETEEQARIQREHEAVTESIPQVKPDPKPSVQKEKVPVQKEKVSVKAKPAPVKKDKVPVKAEAVPVKQTKTSTKAPAPSVKKKPVDTRKPVPSSVKAEVPSVKKTAPGVKKTAPSVKKEAPSVKKTGKK